MATFIIYAIRWAVTLTLLYSLYRLLLGRETFHRLNRVVLLGILMVSPLLPLIPMHTDEPTAMTTMLTSIEEPLSSPKSVELRPSTDNVVQEKTDGMSTRMLLFIVYIYIIGIAVALVDYLLRLLSVAHHIARSSRITHPLVPSRVRLMLNMSTSQPSSWMKWIIIGPIDLKQNATSVLTHELAHVRLHHSWDLLLCDVTCRLLWCLPFAWMLRQDLVDVHEFQADEAVLRHGVTRDDYEHLLVRKAVRAQFLPVMNTLRRGAVKKRFAMMHVPRSSRWASLKLLYLVPALAVSLWVSAKTAEASFYVNGQLITEENVQHIDPTTIDHIDVLKRDKKVMIWTATEPVDTGGVMPGVRPEDAYFTSVEQMPEFRGGKAAFDEYFASHVKYPKIAAENGVQATICVEFIVEADGRITHVHALEPSEPSEAGATTVVSYGPTTDLPLASDNSWGIRALQESAEALIRGMPPFNPGRQKGRAVRVKMSKRITYRLS